MIDGQWHCGNEFREWYIFSPHKRRIEIEGRKNKNEPITGKYKFIERSCVHESPGVKDYLMVESGVMFVGGCKHYPTERRVCTKCFIEEKPKYKVELRDGIPFKVLA